MLPKISIIVPIYNVEQYLNRCIESIIDQTMKSFELILVNDGSLDKCGEICELYKKKDNRIKVIHKPNGGVSSARNIGINISSGEFICFIDPDDYIDKDALEYLYNLVQKNNADIACYRMKVYKNEILESNIDDSEQIKIFTGEDILKEYINNTTFQHSCWNKIYSRYLFEDEECKFAEDIRYAEDALFTHNILMKSKKLVYSNLQKYNYCINSNGVVSNITEKRLDILKAQKEIYKLLKSNHKNYLPNIVNQYINSSILIAQDIAIEGTILEKKSTLYKLKNILKNDRDMTKNIKNINYIKRICFRILSINPILISILYRYKVLILKKYKLRG